jgi:uncharacterized membrane protein YjjP (DUF1212 family)
MSLKYQGPTVGVMYGVSSDSVARIWSLGGAEIFYLAVHACKVAMAMWLD